MTDLEQFRNDSGARAADNKKFLRSLKGTDDSKLDGVFQEAHEEVFAKTDCLQCANCCKTTSPIFYNVDIERLSKALRLRPSDVIDRYLRVDEDGDYVLKTSPCPFLGADNYCSVYDSRPRACREYPHTDRRKISQLLDLTYRNTLVCPAVLQIVERVKTSLNRQ
ncbi:MAG: YkgJ family cysteine cluster protein [Bacteroidota bacterium]